MSYHIANFSPTRWVSGYLAHTAKDCSTMRGMVWCEQGIMGEDVMRRCVDRVCHRVNWPYWRPNKSGIISILTRLVVVVWLGKERGKPATRQHSHMPHWWRPFPLMHTVVCIQTNHMLLVVVTTILRPRYRTWRQSRWWRDERWGIQRCRESQCLRSLLAFRSNRGQTGGGERVNVMCW